MKLTLLLLSFTFLMYEKENVTITQPEQNLSPNNEKVFVCKVSFKDSQFDNEHAGSGFFIKYKGQVYGVTAKHVLFFAKTDSMNSVDFGDELLSWKFSSRSDSTLSIKAGKLINSNPAETLAGQLQGDWLIFEINQPLPDQVYVHELRDTPLEMGEPLSFMGFPYKSEHPEKPLRINGTFESPKDTYSFNMNVPRGEYFGCSGGPVIDSENKVVGLVSMGYYNEQESKMIFEPASVNYFKEIVSR